MPTVTPPVAADLMREVVAAMVTWFYNVEQPRGALLAHNGPFAITGGIEWAAQPRLEFGMGSPLWPVVQMSTLYHNDEPDPRLPEGAEETFLALVTELAGAPRRVRRFMPDRSFNAQGVTVELGRQMHPSLQQSVKNWDNKRCPLPEHDTWSPPKCRDSGTCPWGEQATWLIYPHWPAAVDSHHLG